MEVAPPLVGPFWLLVLGGALIPAGGWAFTLGVSLMALATAVIGVDYCRFIVQIMANIKPPTDK